eukprot:6198161-Pleurochrysis_carterae.AAC.4
MLSARRVLAEKEREERDHGNSLLARRHRLVAPLWLHPWKQTGSARSTARARAGTGAWQRRGAACDCCVKGVLATAEAVHS